MAQRNIVAAVCLLALGGWYGVMTARLPERSLPNTPGPSFFPWIVTVLLLVLSLALLIQGIAGLRPGEAVKPVGFGWRPAVTVLWLALYVAAFPAVGFILASIPFFAGMMLLYGQRRPLVIALLSALVPSALYFLFRDGFRIFLP